jgi:hypothetical protein
MSSSPAEAVPQVSQSRGPGERTKKDHDTRALVKRCFELAYFIFPDRSTALEIVIDALEGVRLKCQRERKRFYWRYTHRKHPVRRISWDDSDLLQWMVMYASENYERVQEVAAEQSLTDMAIRYIKHLVHTTISMSSFYVNVGISRLLFSYSTPEAQELYSLLTQRKVGSDEYRRAKGALMEKMRCRFPEYLRTVRAQYGELKFDIYDEQQTWVGLAMDCLFAFTPWSTRGRCREFTLENDNPNRNVVGSHKNTRSSDRSGADDRNSAEVEWCHALIEPACFGRLVKQLEFLAPEKNLALPRFQMQGKSGKEGGCGNALRQAPELLPEDFERVEGRIAANDKRRREIKSGYVSVVVNHIEWAKFDATYSGQIEIAIEEGVNLVEIRGEDDSGKLLLATHVIPQGPEGFRASKDTVILNTGELNLTVIPVAVGSNEVAQASMNVNYQPQSRRVYSGSSWTGLGAWGRLRSYVLAACTAVLIGSIATTALYLHRIRSMERAVQQPNRSGSQGLPNTVTSVVSYPLSWDGQRVRSQERIAIPEVSLSSGTTAIELDLLLPMSVESDSYFADLETFAGDQKLMSQKFLRARHTAIGRVVPIVVPAALLTAGTYYTVQLHLMNANGHPTAPYRFTFVVVAKK